MLAATLLGVSSAAIADEVIVWAGNGPVNGQLMMGGRQLMMQPVMWDVGMGSQASQGRTEGFSLAAAGTPLSDTPAAGLDQAIAEGDWLKVISLLEALETGEHQALIMDQTGMLRPLSTLSMQVVSQLPPDGVRVFQQVQGPAAQKLYDDALATDDPKAAREMLMRIVDSFGPCEIAPTAATRLGDIQFERGRFREAARLYAFSLNHPESTANDPDLLARHLLALMRAGDWLTFDSAAQLAATRQGNREVTLGGNTQTINALIEQLALARPAPGDIVLASQGPALALPASTYPIAKLDLLNEYQSSSLQTAATNQGLGHLAVNIPQPSVINDGNQLYVLQLGELTAINTHTGDVAWTHGHKDELLNLINQQMYQLRSGYYQSLIEHDDYVITTSHDTQRLDRVWLRVFDKANGEVVWSSQNEASLNQHRFIGEPVVSGNTLHAVALQDGGNKTVLISMDLLTGAVNSTVDLGTPAIDPNWRQAMAFEPRVAVGDRYVSVLTNNGALIAVDPAKQEVAWAMSYSVLPNVGDRNQMRNMRRGGFVMSAMPSALQTPGDVAIVDGVVYAKDTRDNMLHAIRLHDAQRLWSRQVDASDTLIHSDERHAYLLGNELVAVDLHTGQRVWWTSHHGESHQPIAFNESACIVAGPDRMCMVDLNTGKVTQYSEDHPTDASGSGVFVAGGTLALSNRASLNLYEMNEEHFNTDPPR